MGQNKLCQRLQVLADVKHAEFSAKLVPTVDRQRVLGVRMPQLRKIVRELKKNDDPLAGDFLASAPHCHLEEDLMHVLLLNEIRDVDQFAAGLEAFFPLMDNWMVTDAVAPKLPKGQLGKLESYVHRWVQSSETYVVRTGVVVLMRKFLDDLFREDHLRWVAGARPDDYYVHMVVGWYFATAMAKQPDVVRVAFFSPEKLGLQLAPEARRKAIQKSLESYRIPDELKSELRRLRAELKASDSY